MATINFTKTVVYPGHVRIAWPDMGPGDVGEAIGLTEFADRAIAVTGNFDGETVTLTGSLDNQANFLALHDAQGTDLAFSSARLEQILETAEFTRPEVTSASGTPSVTVTLFLKAPK